MSVFVISDLHLSLSENKSMEVFGFRWQNYVKKLHTAWCQTVGADDTVVIPGDISWSMATEDAQKDLAFLDSLPGKKIIGKGNHDYWWQTQKKLKAFCEEKHLTTLSFLYNNAYCAEGEILCGSRGWWNDEKIADADADYAKIVNREAARLQLSLEAGKKLAEQNGHGEKKPLVFLHFPPFFREIECESITSVLHRYGVERVWYGHIHGQYDLEPAVDHDGITYTLVSADYLNFIPIRIV